MDPGSEINNSPDDLKHILLSSDKLSCDQNIITLQLDDSCSIAGEG
jgi:hypothetical protein